ncbi:MAG TPA: S8 family serine peptidase [Actinophytocola sp.]|uniref:S8 family serine peptidase n=1 Tax=Actinophytocola sp. TaxID=1872138 RepID=UPI002DB6B92E|nr:S8 family serine peptidase [Actinophytocola sp.]HEU5469964.1 S8 family serine peptidase [Actinophytocola sp.]
MTTPLVFGLVIAAAPGATAQPALSGKTVEYNVLATESGGVDAAVAAVKASGGTVVKTNRAAGLLTVKAPENGFTARLATAPAVEVAAKAKVIGRAPALRQAPRTEVEKENKSGAAGAAKKAQRAAAGMDPLDNLLWGLTSVRSDLARTKQPGDRRVKVGVIDTGIDGNHPDIAPNFDRALSRNFTQDIPFDELGQVVDGPCEFRGCVDPADWDDGAHGTHVAGTIAAAADGFGISGVAPGVSLVNIRAGQDSGFFFLQPTVDALTYAGDAGIDVVNMSFFVDPWLYNCQNNPADTPEQQAEQRLITRAMTRALNYAHRRGVTQVAALGNQHTDLGNPQPDTISPDYPVGTEHPRTIDNATCLSLPTEGPHVIGVLSYGPSRTKADYSNYGVEQISVSAPGGWFRDYFGTPQFRTNENLILSAYPRHVGVEEGNIDEAGNITPQGVALGVQRACKSDGTCGYYQYLQGTSMASPHAAGVASLIVSQYGRFQRGNASMNPDAVQSVLEGTAFKIPCPVPPTIDYLDEGRDASFTATCTGNLQFNGFYGHGSVDAWAAVTRGRPFL